MNQTIEAKAVDHTELDQLDALAASLPQGSPVAVLLQSLVVAMSRGVDVTVLESDAELTPNEAAEMLHMSRPHLLKFMDRGELDFHRVGSHRRIRLADLMDFIDRRESAKAAVAHALGNGAALDQRVRDETAALNDADIASLDEL